MDRTVRHFLAPWLAAAVCLASCAPRPHEDDFTAFWDAFSAAAASDDAAAVAELTAFPFLFEGEQRSRAEFAPVYSSLFDRGARGCLTGSRPEPEDGRYVVACGPTVFVFGEAGGTWRFVEFTPDPEWAAPAGATETALADNGSQSATQEFALAPGVGRLRVVGHSRAPWASASRQASAPALATGEAVAFGPYRVSAPAPLGCAGATYEFAVTPAEGLFQGSLPAPATGAAAGAGVARLPVLTLAVRCDAGLFDYHFDGAGRVLLGLDDTIWVFERERPAGGPEAVVLDLLEEHLTGDMAFTASAFAPRLRFLSPSLAQQVADYFARSHPANEPPPVNGDPITYSQEYPRRFVLSTRAVPAGPGRLARGHASVPVTFRDGARDREVTFDLVLVAGSWLVDEIRYEDGNTLSRLLRH